MSAAPRRHFGLIRGGLVNHDSETVGAISVSTGKIVQGTRLIEVISTADAGARYDTSQYTGVEHEHVAMVAPTVEGRRDGMISSSFACAS